MKSSDAEILIVIICLFPIWLLCMAIVALVNCICWLVEREMLRWRAESALKEHMEEVAPYEPCGRAVQGGISGPTSSAIGS